MSEERPILALAEWLNRNDPALYATVSALRHPSDGIRLRNKVTGLSVREDEDQSKACALFLEKLKGRSMAMSIDQYNVPAMSQAYQADLERQGAYAEKMTAIEALGRERYADAKPVQPIPNPEPNKVLLLLGEDE